MCTFTLFILFAIIQSSLGLLHSGDFCREDDDHFQNTAQAETFLRRTSVEGEEVKSRLHPAMPSPARNKNSNINLNSAPAFTPPAGNTGGAANTAAPNAEGGKDTGIEGAFTEWWEIVTERIPSHARRTFSKSDTAARANNFETIKSLINKGQAEGTLRRELVSNYGTSYGQNRKSLLSDNSNQHDTKKNIHELQSTRRSKQQSSPSLSSSALQRSIKTQDTVLKNRQAEETPPNIHNELHRKSTENSNANTNLNHVPRRSMNNEPLNAAHTETRKSTNTNKNVNVNDHGGAGGGGGGGGSNDIFELYEKLSKGDADVGPKALGGHMNRPIAERSHSNVNRNVNANVHGDMLPSALLVPDDLRRNLLGKKRYFPRPHHPNDNHNVNININGEEPIDDFPDEAQADPESEPEPNAAAAPPNDS